MEVSTELLSHALGVQNAAILIFSADRTIIYANETAQKLERFTPGTPGLGAANPEHYKHNHYFDIHGNELALPAESPVEKAIRGMETSDWVIEQRNTNEGRNRWLCVNCRPFFDAKGAFTHGVLCYREISKEINHQKKLHFLLESAKILSLTMGFQDRLIAKARLAVPSLADWCAIDLHHTDGSVRRVALVHRDQSQIEYARKFTQKYNGTLGHEPVSNRVIRTGKAEYTLHITDDLIRSAPHISPEQIDDIQKLNLSSIIVVPISHQGRVLGSLTVAYAESRRTYSMEDVAFFTEFGHHLAITLENATLYDEIRKRDIAKDSFLASLSHELRNPLAPIKSALELMRIKNKSPEIAPDIELIDRQFDHLSDLLRDLLDTTRFIHGKITLKFETLDISDIVSHAVNSVYGVAMERGVTLRYAPPGYPLYVRADRTRIEQALLNLLQNAIKFTGNAGTVEVSLEARDDKVIIQVRDTGIGITKDELPYIFEPYYQSKRTALDSSGLGIGLRLVHEIIKTHNGSVEVHSEGENTGSTFTIVLPRTYQLSNTTMTTQPEVETSTASILVVDDNQMAAIAMVRLLQALGWKAHGVYSAQEALAFLKDNHVDILFVDIGMPVMDGYELTRTITSQKLTSAPIVALTGYGLEDDIRKAKEAGFAAHLTKPVGLADIRMMISQLVPTPAHT